MSFGFGGAPATAPAAGGFGAKTTGFGGAAPAAGGFGATAPAAGGFGATAPAAGGFGAKTTGFGGAAPAAGGFGATAPAAGGFGATAPAAGGFGAKTTGFGGAAPAAGGFGATAPAAGGFGAKTTGFGGAAPAAGGFGATAPAAGGFGATAPAAGGFGAKATGFGGGGGFGAPGSSGFGPSPYGGGGFANAAPPAPPYPGVRGAGNDVEWARQVDFSTITDDTPFDKLPAVLQQHLLALRTFTKSEEDARTTLLRYLNDEDHDGAANSSGGSGNNNSTSQATGQPQTSWRRLNALFASAKSGDAAVDGVVARCARREQEATDLRASLGNWEASVRQYQSSVWEPLREQEAWRHGDRRHTASPTPLTRAGSSLNPGQDEPFLTLLTELTQRTERAGLKLQELQAAVLPGEPLAVFSATSGATRGGAGAGGFAGGGLDDVTVRGGGATAMATQGLGVRGAVAQVSTSLENELAALMALSERTARLQSRADIARSTFTRLYGAAEANALFVRRPAAVDLHVGAASARRGVVASVSPYQRLAQSLRPLPPVTPAATATAAVPGMAKTTTGFGPKAGGFNTGAGGLTGGTTGGFNAGAGGLSGGTTGGFNAGAGGLSGGTTGGTGGFASKGTGFGAATGGFGASNPAASPRSTPAAPPSGFSLGPAAAPGSASSAGGAAVGDDARPQRRGRG